MARHHVRRCRVTISDTVCINRLFMVSTHTIPRMTDGAENLHQSSIILVLSRTVISFSNYCFCLIGPNLRSRLGRFDNNCCFLYTYVLIMRLAPRTSSFFSSFSASARLSVNESRTSLNSSRSRAQI